MVQPIKQPLVLEKISVELKGKELISIDETIAPGEVLSVMGPSGSGKSSLLAYIAGFLDPAFNAVGRALLGELVLTSLPAAERRVGMLFQDPLLFPHMSVEENLLFAVPQSVKDASERKSRVADALKTAGLDDYGDRDPATLSGGQQARIALMRILLTEPGALLLDEPFSKLDAKLKSQTRDFVFSEARKRDLPVLLVTHDIADAQEAGGKVFNLEEEEGK